jgi:hypothetical protein
MRQLSALQLMVALLVLPTPPARADGLLHKLPANGAWARFDLEWWGPSAAGEFMVLRRGTLTISSVGRAVVDDEQCRWLEIRNAVDHDGKEVAGVQKLLIPEKYLLAGLNPLGHVVKAWAQHPAVAGGTPQEITDMKGEQARPIRALTDMFFGPPGEIRMLDEELVETTGLGKLRCPGVAARYVLKRGNLESIFDYESRLHDKAPFGVVTFRSESVHKEDGVVRIPRHVTILRLAEFGTDAKSALPGKN